jgi:hypothetical protein
MIEMTLNIYYVRICDSDMKRAALVWIPRFFALLAFGVAVAQITGWIGISVS